MSSDNFNDLKISNDVRKAIKEMGFEKTTPIQKMAIPEALNGVDITAQAQTGTGKTVAFTVPILEKIFIPDNSPQAIILCPTRELCIQVSREIEKMGSNIKKLKVLAVYGGEPIGKQLRVLKKGVHIIVGTPGRVIDHIERGSLNLIGIETVVLDEADEMLDMGFREDIEFILQNTPRQRQTMLFSATMPDEIQRIAKLYQKKSKFIKVESSKKNLPKITQYFYRCDSKHKLNDMCMLIDAWGFNLILIFCNTKKSVDYVRKHLKKRGYSVDAIHGDMSQKVRDKVMNKFRNGNINILVATDVAARGIDVANVDLVINFDVAQTPDNHIHRIGRTARAGEKGYAFTLVSDDELSRFNHIKKATNSKIIQKDVPTPLEMDNVRNNLILEKVDSVIKNEDLTKYINAVNKNKNNSAEIAAALLKMMGEN